MSSDTSDTASTSTSTSSNSSSDSGEKEEVLPRSSSPSPTISTEPATCHVPDMLFYRKMSESERVQLAKEDQSTCVALLSPYKRDRDMHKKLWRLVSDAITDSEAECLASSRTRYIAIVYKSTKARDDDLERLSQMKLVVNDGASGQKIEVPFKVSKFRSDTTTKTTNFLVHADLRDTTEDVQAGINAALRARANDSRSIPQQYSIRKVYHVAFAGNPGLDQRMISVGSSSSLPSSSSERPFVQETSACSVCANRDHSAIVCNEAGAQ